MISTYIERSLYAELQKYTELPLDKRLQGTYVDIYIHFIHTGKHTDLSIAIAV